MKGYEKAAVGIGVAALGLAGYQALKTKQATDAVTATDPSRHPVGAAADQSKAGILGGFLDWAKEGFNTATGRDTGRSPEVVDNMESKPSGTSYWLRSPVDLGLKATEAGTKFLWGLGGKAAASGKEKLYQLTNKPFTLMGSIMEHTYTAARNTPQRAISIGNLVTGVGSRLEKTSKSFKSKLASILPWRR